MDGLLFWWMSFFLFFFGLSRSLRSPGAQVLLVLVLHGGGSDRVCHHHNFISSFKPSWKITGKIILKINISEFLKKTRGLSNNLPLVF